MTTILCVIAMAMATCSPMSMASTAMTVNDGGYEVTMKVEDSWNANSSLEYINKLEDDVSIADIDKTLLSYLGIDQFDLKLLSQITWGEARGESVEGQKLITHVILNRVRENYGGNTTIEGVIYQRSQFSATKHSKYGDYTGREIKSVLMALYERGQGTCDEYCYDIAYFVANKEINVKRYARNFDLIIVDTIGEHTFFKKDKNN